MSDDIQDPSDDAAEFRCLVPFPDGSTSFVHGFEAGMLWQRMCAGEAEIANPIAYHTANLEVFGKMAMAQGYDMESEAPDEEWVILTFRKRPKRFGVIKGGLSA